MTGRITAKRVDEICTALTRAKAGWLNVARSLPEFDRLHYGRPFGTPGHVRPWVLLRGEHEDFDSIPVRLVRFETGVWFMKGERIADVQHRLEGHHHARP